jgi:NAD+ kinase
MSQRVGVVGDETLSGAVEAAGGSPVVGAASTLEDLDFAVAGGEAAVVDLLRADLGVPVLPVDAGGGVRSVATDDAETAVERVFGGEYRTEQHPVISAQRAFDGVRALFDVTLVASEPARISEFSVRCGGESIARFRADGVVASTPAGSVGYNSAAGGPVVATGMDAVSVVPLAPFATDADQWVLPLEEVTLSVERDETPVELLADGRSERAVAAGEPVTLSATGAFETVVVPESERFF